jgi:competence protein ComGF
LFLVISNKRRTSSDEIKNFITFVFLKRKEVRFVKSLLKVVGKKLVTAGLFALGSSAIVYQAHLLVEYIKQKDDADKAAEEDQEQNKSMEVCEHEK